MTDTTNRIRLLNDLARQSFTGCRVVITVGIEALDEIEAILRAVQQYDGFTEDNDPYQEHDFGSFRHNNQTVFWKFDYLDIDLQMHSLDASDPSITTRVLTVMLAEEY